VLLFFSGIFLLIVGYFLYGRLIEKILAPDDRQTPALKYADGVDYVVLPHWKNMLIQLLNIAGVGPIIGVILGIKFGTIVFIILPIGNLLAGATHDFLAGMMSLRHKGANLPTLINLALGKNYYRFFAVFMVGLLLLVVAVFVNIPASIVDGFWEGRADFWIAVGVVFLYYVCATLFPVDKIIGRIYPFFGALLLIGTLAMCVALFYNVFKDPSLLAQSEGFLQHKFTAENNFPIVPMLFVTIACGIISGFHATQSPIIARTMKSERQARSSFYGMMVAEGLIAMIWAGAGLAIYNLFPELMQKAAPKVLLDVTDYFLGSGLGLVTILGVIALAITSGDTAMRALRLSLAEIMGIDQKSLKNRVLLCLPLIAVVVVLVAWSNISADTFMYLWNYFAWGNQVLAASTLMACAAWLWSLGKFGWIAALPGAFMAFVVFTYILWISPDHGGPAGFGLDLHTAYAVALALTLVLLGWVYLRSKTTPPRKF